MKVFVQKSPESVVVDLFIPVNDIPEFGDFACACHWIYIVHEHDLACGIKNCPETDVEQGTKAKIILIVLIL